MAEHTNKGFYDKTRGKTKIVMHIDTKHIDN